MCMYNVDTHKGHIVLEPEKWELQDNIYADYMNDQD